MSAVQVFPAQSAERQRLPDARTAGRLLHNTNALNADLWDPTNMASVVVSLKIMPESVDVSLSGLEEAAKKKIVDFAGEGDMKIEQEPIAFGLVALKIIFIMDESIGSTEKLEDNISDIEGVQSVEITDVRRAIG